MKKEDRQKLKQDAIAMYYDLRQKGCDHPIALSATVEFIISVLAGWLSE